MDPTVSANRSIHDDILEGYFHTVMPVIIQGRGRANGGFFGPDLCWRRTRLSEAKHTNIPILCRKIILANVCVRRFALRSLDHQHPSAFRQGRCQISSSGSFRASGLSCCHNETSPTGSSYCHGGPSCVSHRAAGMRRIICVNLED
jgi:hypothetical protein